MGTIVDVWGRATLFWGARMLCLRRIFESLSVSIFVSILRVWSIRVIGLVCDRSPLYCAFFEIGHTRLLRHFCGIFLKYKHALKIFVRNSVPSVGSFLRISLEMVEGPVAFFIGALVIVSMTS